MDKRRFHQLIYALFILVIGSAALSADDQNLLRAQDWLEADKNKQFQILSRPYARVADDILDDEEKLIYQLGESLFRTPTLLGGQAAKARISCNSCHLSGGDNPSFLFPNISGAPGTADVSNSFFSSFRGNKIFDPLTIPDLREAGKISKDPSKDDLRNFIRDLIVEEFNGKVPSDRALDALSFYVQKLQPADKADLDASHVALSVSDPISIIEQSYQNIKISLREKDQQTAHLLVDSIRHQLGLIFERYNHEQLDNQRKHIIDSSIEIAQIRSTFDRKNLDPEIALQIWRDNFDSLKTSLFKGETISLYNISRLQKSLSDPVRD